MPLLRRCVPSAPGPHPETLPVVGLDLNRPVMPVGLEVRWLVGNGVLAAEFVLNFGECVGYIANLEREEGASPGGIGNALKHLVARPLSPAHVGADGVDDG